MMTARLHERVPYTIGHDGILALLAANAASTGSGSAAIDIALQPQQPIPLRDR